MARIAVGGFQHETNCFVPQRTDFAYFVGHRDRPPLSREGEVLERLGNTSFALSGFLAEMRGHDIVPLLWTSGGAGGTVTRDAFERIAGELVGLLSRALPVDAVYLDLHGAMVTEEHEDGEGELLRRVRAVVGPDVPVVVSLDYHANVTPAMVATADAMVAYRTYPHVDRPETGRRAASVLTRILTLGLPVGRALRKSPFLVPLTFQCTLVDPSQRLVEAAAAVEAEGTVLCADYVAGFPSSDLAQCGPAVIAYAHDPAAADHAADALMATLLACETTFGESELDPDMAVLEAASTARLSTRPVIIADTQDNPGAGGSSDTTGMLEALVRNEARGAVLGILCDPEAAAAAHAAGEGAELELPLGGRHGPDGVLPYQRRYTVLRLGTGKFRTTGPCVGGRDADLGPMALLTVSGVGVVVSSKRMQAHDQAPFRHVGIEPADQKILVLKSSVHFRADFGPLAERVIVALAPGGHVSDPRRLPYRRLRRGVRLLPGGPTHET